MSEYPNISKSLWSLALPIADLNSDPANARLHPDRNLDAIKASLHKFGQRKCIVVQKKGMIVRAGNGTMAAAKSLGWTHLACNVIDEDSTDATSFAIADNRTAELAEWDDETLASLLQSLPQECQIAAGFDPDELNELLSKLTPEVVEDVTPEPPASPVSRLGDLWVCGEHRVCCGDSTNAEAVAALMDGQKIDMCVTSPPYNCDIQYETHDDKMPIEQYLLFIENIMSAFVPHLGNGRFVCWNVGVTPKSRHLDHAALLRKSGLDFYRQVVWAKSGVAFPIWQYTNAARKYHPNYTHEVIFMFSKGQPEPGGACEVDDEYSCDVWEIHQSSATRDLPGESNGRRPRTSEHGGSKNAAHPAAYPVGIPAGCIKHLTSKNENVYEPFCGSGTTLIAAEQLGRKCYGMEISPQYVDVIVARWQTLTGKSATLESSGETFAETSKKRLSDDQVISKGSVNDEQRMIK